MKMSGNVFFVKIVLKVHLGVKLNLTQKMEKNDSFNHVLILSTEPMGSSLNMSNLNSSSASHNY